MGPQFCRHHMHVPPHLAVWQPQRGMLRFSPSTHLRQSVIQSFNMRMEGLFSETAAAAAAREDEPTKGVDPRVVRPTVSPFTTSLPTFPLWLVPQQQQFSSHFVSAVISSHSRCRSVLSIELFWVEVQRRYFAQPTHALSKANVTVTSDPIHPSSE